MIQEKIKQVIRYREAKYFLEKHNRLLVPTMLIAGVVVDFITFKTIQVSTAFILLGIHFIIAGSLIAFVNIYDARRIENRTRFIKYARLIAPLIVQFNFGALLSASLIFYWFSGALSVSWPIMIIIAILMASNELLREYYLKLVVQISVYYFITFSLLSMILPYLFNSISPWLFLSSGALSVGIISIYIFLLSKVLSEVREKKKIIGIIIAIILFVMNLFYFSGVIPPIPLSLREASVCHFVAGYNSDYQVLVEKENIFEKLIPGNTFHAVVGDDAYIYVSIFAPGELNTTIVHHWQYYDKESRKWVDSHKAVYNIVGGRIDGYRGYSLKTDIPKGRWRVGIETERGQTLGRIKFNVKEVDESRKLEWVLK